MENEDPIVPEQAERVISVDCGNCGSQMTYEAASRTLKCSHCGHSQALPAESDMVVERSFSEAMSLEDRPTGFGIATKVFHCDGCGSETAVELNSPSIECPFCGSKNVNEEAHESRVIQPSGIMGFKIERNAALLKFKEWIGKGWFHPNDLKKLAKLDKLAGIYLPFWTYDTNTSSSWWAEAGYYYYVTESYTDSQGKSHTRQVRRTRWVPASGYYEHFFDDVLVVGSNGVTQNMVEKIFPYELNEVINYDSKFLLGWKSEVYQKDVKEGFAIADGIMDRFIHSQIVSRIPGDTYRNLSINTRKSNVTFKHVLLPLWLSGYRYGKKVFQFLVNGQTGKAGGSKPLSFWKIAFAVLLALAIGGAIYYFTQMK